MSALGSADFHRKAAMSAKARLAPFVVSMLRSCERVKCALAMCALMASVCGVARAAEPPVTALAFSPSGKTILVASQAGLSEQSWPELALVRKLDVELDQVHDLAFSRDGQTLAVAGGSVAESGAVELWSWPSAERRASLSIGVDVVYDVAFDGDDQTLAAACLDRSIHVIDAASHKTLTMLEGHSRGVLAVAFLGQRQLLASASDDATIRLWDASTGEIVRSLSNHTLAVHALATRPQADAASLPMLASAGDDRTVRFWQPTIGRMVRFTRLPAAVLAIAWTADGAHVVAACADGHVRVVQADTLELVADRQVLDGWCYAVAIAHDGREAAVGGTDGQVRRVSLSSDDAVSQIEASR